MAQESNIVWSSENFENLFLNYSPERKEGVSDDNFSFGKMVVSETQKIIQTDTLGFNVARYWNITTAFYALKERKEIWLISFNKMANSKGSCEYLESYKESARFYSEIEDLYNERLNNCKNNIEYLNSKNFDLDKYISKNELNRELVELFQKITFDDQKYRNDDYQSNHELQTELDKKNIMKIDSLYKKYNAYVGKSLVGNRFEPAMWAVIQHSNLQMMEKYLPIIQEAVQNNELKVTPFKMLLDRIYTIKYDYQIFGSQEGVNIADKKTRLEVAEKYGIE